MISFGNTNFFFLKFILNEDIKISKMKFYLLHFSFFKKDICSSYLIYTQPLLCDFHTCFLRYQSNEVEMKFVAVFLLTVVLTFVNANPLVDDTHQDRLVIVEIKVIYILLIHADKMFFFFKALKPNFNSIVDEEKNLS